MTCQHPQIAKVQVHGLAIVTCKECGHRWLECPMRMSDREYDDWLLLVAAKLNPSPEDTWNDRTPPR